MFPRENCSVIFNSEEQSETIQRQDSLDLEVCIVQFPKRSINKNTKLFNHAKQLNALKMSVKYLTGINNVLVSILMKNSVVDHVYMVPINNSNNMFYIKFAKPKLTLYSSIAITKSILSFVHDQQTLPEYKIQFFKIFQNNKERFLRYNSKCLIKKFQIIRYLMNNQVQLKNQNEDNFVHLDVTSLFFQ